MAEDMVLRKTARVPLSKDRAYALFVHRMASWWPLDTHKVSDQTPRACFFEDRPGGRIYEVDVDGTEHLWGTVTAASPPDEVAFTWHPGGSPETAQSVVIHFMSDAEGTVIELEQSGWELLGEKADQVRASYDTGWDYVLGERYVEAAASSGQ